MSNAKKIAIKAAQKQLETARFTIYNTGYFIASPKTPEKAWYQYKSEEKTGEVYLEKQKNSWKLIKISENPDNISNEKLTESPR